MHERNCYLTLTYDDEHLPEGHTVRVEDWQLFARRMRKQLGPFRFFHCGEYGEKKKRPHYHAAIFGLDFRSDQVEDCLAKGGEPLYKSKRLSEIWENGDAFIGELTFASAAYVARYITKKITGPGADLEYEGRKPPYTTMSRRPGIGKTWIDKYMSDVYPQDKVFCGGGPGVPPKYYDEQYAKINPEGYKKLKAKRIKKIREEDQTADRLRDADICAKARIRHHVREI